MASRVLKKTGRFIVRAYALAIMLLILWAGYTAIAFLFNAVFRPIHVSPEFLAWQGSLDAEALRQEHVAGVTGPAARAPLSHYHRVDRWFQPDPHDGCTASGCHSPLPHGRSKELRAFANLHATFMDCRMCHQSPGSSPMPTMWVSTRTGRAQGVPPILELAKRLEGARPEEDVKAFHADMTSLLQQSIDVMGGEPALSNLLLRLRTSEPNSPVWRRARDQLAVELPAHARGEYGAKIAPRADDAQRARAAAELAELTRRYRAAAGGSREREECLKEIHAGLLAKPRACLACHGGEPARLDFESLGYSVRRAADLRKTSIAKLMQDIQGGKPFYLPKLGEGGDVR